MNKAIFQLLLKKKAYLYLSLAFFLSNIGTAFTAIAVYGEFAKLQVPAFFYSFAFILGLAPGLVTSHFSVRLGRRFGLAKVLVATQVAGGLLVILPLIGALEHNLWLLVLAEAIGSMIGGTLAPLYQEFLRKNFQDDELGYVSVYDSYVYTAQFILGQALGTLIYGSGIGTVNYILFDIGTYVLAAVIVLFAVMQNPTDFRNEIKTSAAKLSWEKLTTRQKRAFWLMPLLSLACAPAMAVLPAEGAKIGSPVEFLLFSISPALLFLFAKALGQLLAPQLLAKQDFEKLARSNGLLLGCVALYLLCYAGVYSLGSFGLAMPLIILAHIASNIVFVLASYSFTKNFSAEQIAMVSSRNYQASILSMSVAAFVGGFIANAFGNLSTVILGSLMLVLWALHLKRTRESQ